MTGITFLYSEMFSCVSNTSYFYSIYCSKRLCSDAPHNSPVRKCKDLWSWGSCRILCNLPVAIQLTKELDLKLLLGVWATAWASLFTIILCIFLQPKSYSIYFLIQLVYVLSQQLPVKGENTFLFYRYNKLRLLRYINRG